MASYGYPPPSMQQRVRTPDGDGAIIRWTYWGNDRIRWYLVRLDDGREKSYSLGEWRPLN